MNGDAESGPGATNSTDSTEPPGWQRIPSFTAVVYGTPEFPSTSVSAANGGGNNFFAGGPDNGFGDSAAGSQIIDVSGAAPEIDQGNVQATLSADLGGFANQEDSTSLTAVFTDAETGSVNGALALEAVTPQDRGGETTLIRRTSCTTLTPGARQAYVQLFMQRSTGPYNDGYADNVSVTLSRDPCPTAPDAPLPPPAPPEPGVSANATAVSGRVLVKRPGGTFQQLTAERSIPIGAEVDVSKGVVSLQTASNSSGKTQTARFYQGSFVLGQKRGSRPITDLTLTGRIDKCAGTKDAAVGTARKSRRLWGNGRGRFRTRGRYATATVRGTVWRMTDTCSATTTSVKSGTVIVRDLVKRRNVTVKRGRSYTARARAGR